MGIVAVLCPKTGVQISTGLEMDRAGFDAMPVASHIVDCWACGGRHTWSRRWAALLECGGPEFRKPGIPIPKSGALTPA